MSHNPPTTDTAGLTAILARSLARLSSYLVHHRPDLDPLDSDDLADLYGRYASHLDRFLYARYIVTIDPPWAEATDEIRKAGGLDAFCNGTASRTSAPAPPQYIPLRTLMEMQSQSQEEGDTEDDH
jgi:hypothetical protein